ncbi:RagB/SusD family nutrient uptake outer membrane protein [Nibrella saemangeumensis]|uniref:RagB/SusD family nutrient uptake outer membrane protein n=1 Tax=Nibrella saemangeumensis TaxID=1084526 RepID=A0ABP8MYU1_9BACT
MKKLKIAILSMVGLLTIYGCTKTFLDLTPQNAITDVAYWKSDKDFEAGVNAAYFALQWNGASFPWYALAGMPTGDLKPNENANHFNLEALNFQAVNSELVSSWSAGYEIITRANLVLSRMEKAQPSELTADLKTRLVGEGKFLRGFGYFQLARQFGGVPLILDEQTATSPTDVPRAPVEQVWAQVAKDFTDAATNLPVKYDAVNVGRATRGSALGYLAYTYMYLKDWQKAAKATEDLMALGIYDLTPDYKKTFAISNENNEETVFEVQYRDSQLGWGASRNGHYLPQQLAPRGIGEKYAPYGGWGNQLPTEQVVKAFEPGDVRRKAQILVEGDEPYYGFEMEKKWTTTGYAYTKWWQGPSANDHSAINLKQLRYAEVLLNYAEILNELGRTAEAYTHINRVRARAKLPPKTAGTKEKALDDIMQERRVETLCEYNQWYHLTRTGKAAEFLKKEYGRDFKPHQVVFPIPQSELDVNRALTQNPGY